VLLAVLRNSFVVDVQFSSAPFDPTVQLFVSRTTDASLRQRADELAKSGIKSSGLGLAICKGLQPNTYSSLTPISTACQFLTGGGIPFGLQA